MAADFVGAFASCWRIVHVKRFTSRAAAIPELTHDENVDPPAAQSPHKTKSGCGLQVVSSTDGVTFSKVGTVRADNRKGRNCTF